MNLNQFNHLINRSESQLKTLCVNNKDEHSLIISSPSDLGVIRNGGRSGARFGPQAILYQLLRLQKNKSSKPFRLCSTTDHKDFTILQENEIEQINSLVKNSDAKNFIHIGGGHDHIFPFVSALEKPLHIVNLDAHLDTRIDQCFHSGTPFRQILNNHKNVSLTQVGIHSHSNAPANYHDLNMTILDVENAHDFLKKDQIEEILKIGNTKEYEVLLSIDMDSFDSSYMKAVSCPNPNGLKLEFIHKLILEYKNLKQEQKYIGLYEYNPVYDDISSSAAKIISSMVYSFI